jgi:AcrR family transcriptional regulator
MSLIIKNNQPLMTQQPATSAKSSKPQLIVETAYKLFKQNGFYATGVDLIMREAGVSKRTLYQYFPSKNDLVVAVLEYYREQYQHQMDALLDRQNRTPRENILAIFEDAKNWFGDVNFHGCLAVNAMAEYAGKGQTIESACLRFKQWELGLLRELTDELDAEHGEALAHQLFVLLEGMGSIAQVVKTPLPIDMSTMAEMVIEQRGQQDGQQPNLVTTPTR